MKEKKKSWVSWLTLWAADEKSLYMASVMLAVANVILKIIPYFLIADIVKMLLGGERDFPLYLMKTGFIALSFTTAELMHSLSTTLSHKATFSVLADIRKMCTYKLAKVSLGYVKDTPSGSFKNIMVERIDSIETTLAHIVPEFTSNLLAPLFILIYFFTLDWRLALWSLLPVIAGFLSYGGMMINYKSNFERTVKATRELNDAAVEYIDGIEVIKAFGKTESSYDKFTKAAVEYASSFIDWMRSCSIYHAVAMTVTPYTLLTVLPFGAHYVASGSLSLSAFIQSVILSLGIVGPIITVMSYTDDLGKIDVIVGEVASILSEKDLERPEKNRAVPEDNSIVLEDVHFAYHDKEVLHGITMSLSSGSVNAVVGPSGSGKSTIAKLIASFWDVSSGSIKIGGVDIRDLSLEEYNERIAYVAQDNYLFNESVMENIRHGRKGATDEDVIAVTKKSGCYDFIMELEDGFDTVVGGAGGRLSGGERQRISIARAMLKDAPVVILDEATAYSDPENEAILQNSIASLVEGKTLIVIAHRLSTVRDSDTIFVVEDGMISAYGKHEELLSASPLYREMWNAHISAKDTAKEEEENV